MLTADELVVHVAVADDGARDELGEQGHVSAEGDVAPLGVGLAPVKGFLYGAKPAAMGLIFSAFITVCLTVVLPNVHLDNLSNSSFDGFSLVSLVLVAIFVLLSQIKINKKKLHPLILICISAVLGALIFGVFQL